MKNIKYLLLIILIAFLSSCDSTSSLTPIKLKDFSDISFSSQTFIYDGEYHSIYVEGAPEEADVLYTGNAKKDVGDYIVIATISMEGYNTITLNAHIIISEEAKLNFNNIIFNNLTIEYDGNPHSLEATNLSNVDGLTVTYSRKNIVACGTYSITATISAPGYNSLVLTAQLIIAKHEFKNLSFKDQEFDYDGAYHSICVEGAPEGATISYSNNKKSEVGTYTVTATVSMTNYKTVTLTAILKIVKRLPKIESLCDKTLFYDGSYQFISFTFPDNLPSYTQAEYYVDGVKVEDMYGLRVKTLGTHKVAVTLTNSKYGYESTTTEATITIISQEIGGVDQGKNPYSITSTTKYTDLVKEILKGNFTVKSYFYNDFDYDKDGTYEVSNLSSTTMYYVSNGESFTYYTLEDKDSNLSNYRIAETSWSYSKIVDNEVLKICFEEGLLANYYCVKMPSSANLENIVALYGLKGLSYLSYDDNGLIINGQEGGYTTSYGSFTICEEENYIRIDVRNHYYHTEWNHDEHTVYIIYNIGNTKINILPMFDVNSVPYQTYKVGNYSINGFEYSFTDTYAICETSFNALDKALLEEGEYILPVYVETLPVKQFNVGYYDKYINQDLSGYTIKVYFDKYGYYQGEYESLGKITNYSNIDVLIDDGATVLYYGEW